MKKMMLGLWTFHYRKGGITLQQNYKSTGYLIRCKCGEWAKWCVIGNDGAEIYVCERCFDRDYKC